MDISKFEQFTKTGTKLSNNNISINKAHNFGFNSGFYHRSGIKNFKFVVLYFNKQENSIGFYFLTMRLVVDLLLHTRKTKHQEV